MAEYEYVEHMSQLSGDGGDDADVMCPVCRGANLTQTGANVILCPKRDCLRVNVMGDGITLADLRSNLAEVIYEHEQGCAGDGTGDGLKFVTREQFGITTLVGGCAESGCEHIVI